jgi:hypothetical protein
MAEAARNWRIAANVASNLSETELLVGDVAAAAVTAQKSVALADRAGDVFWRMCSRVTHAGALHAAGELEIAAGLFTDAERRQRELLPQYLLLISMQGYLYCDLLLSQGRAAEARERAAQTIDIARGNNWVLHIALDNLTLGRAQLGLALRLSNGPTAQSASSDARDATAKLDEAVEGLHASGEHVWIARGLLARAACRRAFGGWDGAARDLDEVEEIAEPGPMRLYLCDCALERARLALARLEAFTPLNGLLEPSAPPPPPPDAAASAGLREEARAQLDAARKLIVECGYHRRDEELAELDDVVAGRRRFADLPPRV